MALSLRKTPDTKHTLTSTPAVYTGATPAAGAATIELRRPEQSAAATASGRTEIGLSRPTPAQTQPGTEVCVQS